MHFTLFLFKVAFFVDRIWRLLNGYAISPNMVTICTGLRGSLNRCHQISGYEANQAIDSIPACWIAICEKLLFSLNVICIECVVLISITIIYFGVRNTYQFHHLQTGSCLRTLTTARASS